MPVSCSLQKVVCCLSWLAVLLCEVLAQFKKKKHVKKGLDRTMNYGKKAMLAPGLWDLR